MPITLHVHTYRAAPPAEPLSACFDTGGGTIGRSPGNGLVLDDPGRYISRCHARIEFHNGSYCLVDTGSNPSLVNGRPLGQGSQAALADGDKLAMGEYILEVHLGNEPALDETLPFIPRAQPEAAPAVAVAAVMADMPGPSPLPEDVELPPLLSPVPAGATIPVAPAGPDAAIVEALLRGMGVASWPADRSPVELAELTGAMLREATAGAIGLLLARTLIKRESQLAVTMLVSQANNPLKFFPNVDGALQQMLGTPKPGYMAPEAAFANAFEDMRLHWAAMMAGMRAALDAAGKHFDPAIIEQGLPIPSAMDKVLQANRKARLWDHFVASWQQAAADSGEEFQRQFGEQFASAYEEELERMRQGRASPTPRNRHIV
jgi:predicted component of type VI protein secretion system